MLIAVYDESINNLVELGWIKTSTFRGWTVHDFRWEDFIESKEDDPE